MSGKCVICACEVPHDKEHFEPRFGYYFCNTHREIPPVRIDDAIQQYVHHFHTKWDVLSSPIHEA